MNLTNGNVIRQALDPKSAEMYIGGRGLGTKHFYDEVDPKGFLAILLGGDDVVVPGEARFPLIYCNKEIPLG